MGAVRLGALALLLSACTPSRYEPPPIDLTYVPPARDASADAGAMGGEKDPAADPVVVDEQAPEARNPLHLEDVLESVTSRFPPYLSALLERDLASGRLQQAMGGFDTNLTGKVGGRLQGFYESTVAQGLVEQPLATGDTVYGGYRISDGFLPDYYDQRTQDDGEFVLGVRVPILRGRDFDKRRAEVRKAEIGVELAEPNIVAARIAFVRAASETYFRWEAAGRKLAIARELLKLATDRQDGLQRAVDRQFLAPIALTDNERLITQRKVYVVRAERSFQKAALALSLYLRNDEDRPVLAGVARLPQPRSELPQTGAERDADVARAIAQRPEVRALQLQIDQTETERELADNDVLPNLDLVVEAQHSPSENPYKDIEEFELFVGGELKLPFQRRAARGRVRQAEAKLNRLRLKERFIRDRIVNDVLDARSALQAAAGQFTATSRNVDLAQQLVEAEQRAFDLGRSDLLRIQLREAQLADARVLAVDARLGYERARVQYRAALGETR